MAVVLVGESNRALNSELCYALEKIKLQAKSAYTGEEAVYFISRNLQGYEDPISLVILDAYIRGLSGLAVLERVSRLEGAARIPVIFTVEAYLRHMLDSGFEKGVFGFFVKPLNVRKAAVTIKAVISGDSAKIRQASHSHDQSAIVTKAENINRLK